MAAVVSVVRERPVGGAVTTTVHYCVTSLRGTAEQLGGLIRRHWAVESDLHRTLDVCFREDASRTRVKHAGANLGLVRRVAVSLRKHDPGKGSIPTKRCGPPPTRATWGESCGDFKGTRCRDPGVTPQG